MIYEQIIEAANFIQQNLDNKPSVAIICGSGLGGLTNNINNAKTIDYASIPNFPTSSVKGHSGNLVIGNLGGKYVVAMQGRFHFYEGYTMPQVTLPVRIFKQIGIETLIVTNAAGGLNPNFEVGDIMTIKDHINLMPNPLIGKNDERFGERFPSINGIYNIELRDKFMNIANRHGINAKEGIYLGLTGPSFETNAEYRFFRIAGADCVGMSTIPEVIVASHCGLKVIAASVISNVFRENATNVKSTHEDVLKAVGKTSVVMEKIVEDFVAIC
jgi:purine-nucleoside phosphorylase